MVQDKLPGMRLRIIGDGDDFPRVQRLVDELGVAETVSLEAGVASDQEVIPTQRASVWGRPIVDDPFTKYMLPVKLLEYVALGMPVIASSTATIRAHFTDDDVGFDSAW